MKRLLYLRYGCEQACIVGLALHHFVVASCLFQILHRLDAFLPDCRCLVENLQLALEHCDGVVAVCHSTDYLRAHCLTICLCLKHRRLGVALVVEQLSEHVDFPACGSRDGVRPRVFRYFRASIGSRSAIGCQSHARQIAELGALQLSFGDIHIQTGVLKIDIAVESYLNERLQLRVGKHLFPFHIAESR